MDAVGALILAVVMVLITVWCVREYRRDPARRR